jgi:hypothetical protein
MLGPVAEFVWRDGDEIIGSRIDPVERFSDLVHLSHAAHDAQAVRFVGAPELDAALGAVGHLRTG